MTGTSKKIKPPTKPGNGKVHPMPSGPSKKIRDEYVRKVKDTVKKKDS